MSYEDNMRRHQEQIQAVLKAEQDLINLQKQHAAMTSGQGYQAPQQQQQYQPAPGPSYQPAPGPSYGQPQQPQYQQQPQQQQQCHQPAAPVQNNFKLRRVNINIVEARNLKDVRVNKITASYDVYCKIWVGEKKHKTQVYENVGTNPRLNAQMDMAIDDQDRDICLALWEYDNILPSQEIGRTTYQLSTLRQGNLDDKWLELRDEEGKISGEVHVVFTPLE
ncbi:hypothetical protein H9P43_003014 [Blastocladiella emersonii ATCC 22665]|nr:hypothetical protein H9P43_003014 [Blastocladiella emersonii ATCC 22665]